MRAECAFIEMDCAVSVFPDFLLLEFLKFLGNSVANFDIDFMLLI